MTKNLVFYKKKRKKNKGFFFFFSFFFLIVSGYCVEYCEGVLFKTGGEAETSLWEKNQPVIWSVMSPSGKQTQQL